MNPELLRGTDRAACRCGGGAGRDGAARCAAVVVAEGSL